MFERSPRDKRYGWHRRYNGFVSHPKWRVVATMTTLPITQVICVADALCEAANKGRPRGSVTEFSVLECAAAFNMRKEHVERIYAALEEVGWLDREYISTWDERQPDKEDPTARERQQRRRTKIRQQNQSASRRDKRDVTPRPDTDKQEEEAAVTDIATGDRVTWDKAEAWLKEHRTGQHSLPLGPVALKQRGSR